MTRLFRYMTRLLLLMTAAAALAGGLGYYLLSRSLPDYARSLVAHDITAPVEIVRDNHAVPHIFAQNDQDAWFGLGYAHAEDRLWQMLMARRKVQGRLSELFGSRTLPSDRLMRTLGLYDVARASVPLQEQDVRTALDAYAAGVNARLRLVREAALGRGAPELFLFSPKIAPWTPADSLALLRLMAFAQTNAPQTEILQARLRLSLPPARVRDLYPDDIAAPIISLDDYAQLRPDSPALPPIPLAGASNAFAIAPTRSASGGALLANDPHMHLTAPGPFMLARLELESGGVIGASIPGIPAIFSGRNADLAWGITASQLDDADLYFEQLVPEDPTRYLIPGGDAPLASETQFIKVKDAPNETLHLQSTRHGPVLSPDMFGAGSITPEGHLLALSWTGFDPDDQTLAQFHALMRAHDMTSAEAAISSAISPSFVITIASKRHIALRATGAAPQRDPAHMSQGRYPTPGWRAENDWQGYLPQDSNPGTHDPAGGILVNTNNRISDVEFPAHWSYNWEDDQRILRAQTMLNGREYHTLDSLIEIQTDIVSPAARGMLPLIGRDLWFSGEAEAQGTVGRRRQDALARLANWNGEMSEHAAEPLIYAAWLRALQRRLVEDDLGRIAPSFYRPDPAFIERVFRDIDDASVWCDIKQTSDRESCTDTARAALDHALLELTERYGKNVDSWRWGSAHHAVHRHEILGNNPLFGWAVNIGQNTGGGDFTLMRGMTAQTNDDPYRNIHAAGFRAVYDLADPEASLFVTSTGQSGHFLSRHYDDLAQIWRRADYIPMALDPVTARGGSRGITHILPPTAN